METTLGCFSSTSNLSALAGSGLVPHTDVTRRCLIDDSIKKMRTQVMERGVITFPIKTKFGLLDASTLIRILEVHQEEKIANLKEIAIRSTLLQEEDIAQL